jgi:hypothetical protein
MPYVKISDPNIIDLAAWHQVINVVNQHTDSLDAIVNTTGVAFAPTYDADGGWATVYDPGNQMIQYGVIRMDSDNNEGIPDSTYTYYEEELLFPAAFSATPSVVITNSSQSSTSGKADWDVTVSTVSSDRFKVKLVNATKTAIPGAWSIKVYFMALGPKN